MSQYQPVNRSVLTNYPSGDESGIDETLLKARQNFNKKIIVLDDDPTGIQTVHDVFVYTDWEEASIEAGFQAPEELFFILTNSRSFSREETIRVHQEIARRIGAAAQRLNRDFLLISRGDSTLRGHYPLETDILKNTLTEVTGKPFDGVIFCPFFPEGGRYTLNNIHYVLEQEQLVPTGLTEFAKDQTFGYSASHLGDYVAEKSLGATQKSDCLYITLDELRRAAYTAVTEKLLLAENGSTIIVNAISYMDLKVFCVAWLRAMAAGKNYLARSAAALPKAIGNISTIPLLSSRDMITENTSHGGIVIIGSHVGKTTAQLASLQTLSGPLEFLEFRAEACFKDGHQEDETLRVLTCAEALIPAGITPIIYTSRKLLLPATTDPDEILKVSVRISDALTSIINKLSVKPKFIIAKGGITSSDVGTKGLLVKKAFVCGQIKKGIPVWRTGSESKFPHIPYIIFPGNTGETDTLKEIVKELLSF